ncbi:MAG: C-methyltransferase [Frankiales bacterium]|nr:C-methyltransferase [Frankiales bacterium]
MSEPVGHNVTACRSCGRDGILPFLDLGSTPVANALVPADRLDETDASYPLGVAYCPECYLVQVTHALPAEVIFSSDYPYFSSYSDSLLEHSKAHVDSIIASRGIDEHSFVVEVASNDGYLLRWFAKAGARVLGIEPTPEPAAAARAVGVDTLQEFFGVELADKLVARHGHADVIVANNVMAHVPDLNGFVAGFARLLAPGGRLSVENPGVRYMIEHVEFDTIYHEHFCYFSCLAVDKLLERHGLHLQDIELFPDLHGGTLRWIAGHEETRTARAQEFLDAERAAGLDTFDYYASYGATVASLQADLRELLAKLKADGASIAAYGAAAKGATLLNSTGIDHTTVDFVADKNPQKQGKWMPGCRLEILPAEALLERKPDYTLMLAWNFADEIIRQQSEYRATGGKFIVPVPSVRIVQ